MTRLASSRQTCTPHQERNVWPLRISVRASGYVLGESSAELDFEPGTLLPGDRDLKTRPPRPKNSWVKNSVSLNHRQIFPDIRLTLRLGAVLFVKNSVLLNHGKIFPDIRLTLRLGVALFVKNSVGNYTQFTFLQSPHSIF
ncbi:hypothetical protein AVEN_260806-1 [Araneus ventricosus]|uniref:Uncharacterized protein n=1 Tax=Araneus ventricosus TaxID=182803 RepID=A0A4Y2FB23_ARAVE|nr:hypothetical protein AVEN_260806-1 [Araneus ventricosus]